MSVSLVLCQQITVRNNSNTNTIQNTATKCENTFREERKAKTVATNNFFYAKVIRPSELFKGILYFKHFWKQMIYNLSDVEFATVFK